MVVAVEHRNANRSWKDGLGISSCFSVAFPKIGQLLCYSQFQRNVTRLYVPSTEVSTSSILWMSFSQPFCQTALFLERQECALLKVDFIEEDIVLTWYLRCAELWGIGISYNNPLRPALSYSDSADRQFLWSMRRSDEMPGKYIRLLKWYHASACARLCLR